MSRRKQAKPRSLKREEEWEADCGEKAATADPLATPPEGEGAAQPPPDGSTIAVTEAHAQFGASSESLHLDDMDRTSFSRLSDAGSPGPPSDNSLESDALGTEAGSSWRSETPPDESPSASSCATPNSASDLPDTELAFTVGVTEGTPYACQFCDKAFPRLSYLKKHEQTHSDQMPFRCEFCSRLFKHKRSRDRHIKLHTGDKKYRCTHCEAAFSRSDHLKIHMKTHDNQKPFQCTVCNRGYNTAAALTSHMQNHKKEGSASAGSGSGSGSGSGHNTPSPGLSGFRCLSCGDSFRRPDELQSHVATQHGSMLLLSPTFHPAAKLACIYCTKDSFTSMEALQLHVHAMHGSILNGEYSSQQQQQQQRQSRQASPAAACTPPPGAPTHPSPQPQLPPQQVDGRQSQPPPQSQQPQSQPQQVQCELCTMRFASLSALRQHAAAVHGLQCGPCQLAFPSAALFAEHYLLAHEQLRPTDLSKKAHQPQPQPPSLLQQHHPQQQHDSRPPAKRQRSDSSAVYEHPGTLLCSQCSAALPDFESFREHVVAHHLEPAAAAPGAPPPLPLPPPLAARCPHCGAACPGDEALAAHVASHFLATATEFGCSSCLKLFAKPDELQKHLMDIHAHHLYRCSLCKDMFDSKVAIQVHFAVKHSNECKLYRCTGCPAAVFRSEADFGLHVRATHAAPAPGSAPAAPAAAPAPGGKAHRCLFCRLSFCSELEMQFHMAAHSKQFHCPVCREAFHVEFLLDKHMQTHHSAHQVMNGSASATPEPLQHGPAARQLGQKSSPKAKGGRSSSDSSGAASRLEDDAASTDSHQHPGGRKGGGGGGGGSRAGKAGAAGGGGGAVSLQCAYCSETCKSRTELENHTKTHAGAAVGGGGAGGGAGAAGGGAAGKHKCNICDELCPSAAVLAEHKLTHCKVAAGAPACTACKAPLLREEDLRAHLASHAGDKLPAPCPVCRQTLVSDIEVRVHAKFHVQQGQQQQQRGNVPCFLCLKPGAAPADADPPVCTDCLGKAAAAAAAATAAAAAAVAASGPQPRCQECHLKCESPQALEAHIAAAHRKAYQCIKCQVSFDSEAAVQRHVATHLLEGGGAGGGGARLECHVCRRALASPLQLQTHLIEHTFAGCGSFTCYLCSAVFTAAAGLQQHMLAAHGPQARPYDCARCGLRFFFRAELDNHTYSHHNEREDEKVFYQHSGSNGTYELDPCYKPQQQPIEAALGSTPGRRSRSARSSKSASPRASTENNVAMCCTDSSGAPTSPQQQQQQLQQQLQQQQQQQQLQVCVKQEPETESQQPTEEHEEASSDQPLPADVSRSNPSQEPLQESKEQQQACDKPEAPTE